MNTFLLISDLMQFYPIFFWFNLNFVDISVTSSIIHITNKLIICFCSILVFSVSTLRPAKILMILMISLIPWLVHHHKNLSSSSSNMFQFITFVLDARFLYERFSGHHLRWSNRETYPIRQRSVRTNCSKSYFHNRRSKTVSNFAEEVFVQKRNKNGLRQLQL